MFTFEGAHKEEIAAYINDHWPRLEYVYNLVTKHVSARGHILDIGAKPFVLSYMLDRAGFDYTGIGVSSGEKDLRKDQTLACSVSPASNKPFHTVLNDGKKQIPLKLYETNIELNDWPFANCTFDGMIWTETLEHLTSDPAFAWQQANRVLKNNGVLIFSVPNALYWIRAVQLLLGKNIDDPYSWHGPFGRHNRLYTAKEIRSLAQLHGFKVISLQTHTFLQKEQPHLKRWIRQLVNLVSTLFGKRKGKTIVAVLAKVSDSKEVQRPAFLYH